MDSYYYGVFVLGYDLLHDYFITSKECECDLVFEKSKIIYDDFLKSKFNVNSKSEYECLQDYVNKVIFKK